MPIRKIIFLSLLLFPLFAAAFESDKPLSSPQDERRAENLFKEIRCVVCTSQSIAESNADIAHDLRSLIRDDIKKGLSDKQIKDYIVSRYGQQILMQPPLKASTYLLWFMPLIILIYGGYIIFRRR